MMHNIVDVNRVMKQFIKILSIALVSGAALVSCSKINPTGGSSQGGDTPGGGTQGGGTDPEVTTRIITLSFDTEKTRTYLDGNDTPHFNEGDLIKVARSDGQALPEECPVQIDDDIATIETKLAGELIAVYPSERAVIRNNKIVGVTVPSVQTGLFEDANICMATIPDGQHPKAEFKNQTALIVVTVPTNTDYIEVTSLCEIGTDGYRGTTRKAINTESGEDSYSIVVRSERDWGLNNTSNVSDYHSSTYYVSVAAIGSDQNGYTDNNVRLIDLNFDILSKPSSDAYHYDDEVDDSGERQVLRVMGGFTPEQVWKSELVKRSGNISSSSNVYVLRNNIYVLPSSLLHQYVKVGDCKWATMNIGATSPEDPGDFFFWAGLDGHRYDESVEGHWTHFAASTYTFDLYRNPTDGFFDSNAPYYSGDAGSGYTEYNGSSKSLLMLWDDAAFVHWGGAWSMMPANGSSSAFTALSDGRHIDINNDTVNDGFLFDGVFIPYNLRGDWNDLENNYTHNTVEIWSSSVNVSKAYEAKIFQLMDTYNPDIVVKNRSYGYPIRPVSVPPSGTDSSTDITVSHDPLNPGGNL